MDEETDIDDLVEHIEAKAEEVDVEEHELEGEIRETGETLEWLREKLEESEDLNQEPIADVFVRLTEKLIKEVSALNEITEHVERIEEEEGSYIKVLNRVRNNGSELSREKIGEVTREDIEKKIEGEKENLESESQRLVNEINTTLKLHNELSKNLDENQRPTVNKSRATLVAARAQVPGYQKDES